MMKFLYLLLFVRIFVILKKQIFILKLNNSFCIWKIMKVLKKKLIGK
jgi:hypothetical protein